MNSRRYSKFLAGLVTSLILLSLLANSAMAAAGDTTRVSVASNGTQGNGYSTYPSVSADGRYVAFSSDATNLVSGDTNGACDVFVHDRQMVRTTRVSVATDGTQGNEVYGCTADYKPSISADGRYVTFWTDASNLVSGDTNSSSDVFVHDRQTGQTTRVSVATDGTQGNSYSRVSSISADGRYVAFGSQASNLVSGDTNNSGDVFVHDLQMVHTTRISVSSEGTQGNNVSWFPSISADGRYVAFLSYASNLVSGDTNGYNDVFIHDRQTGQTMRVSVATDGTQGNGDSLYPFVSGDGRYVAFHSISNNLVSGDTNNTYDIFVHDLLNGQTTRVSVATDGTQGNGNSFSSSISANGRYVAFWSYASNLVSGDTNGTWDVFVHDRQSGKTTRVSLASSGTQGNSDSGYPSISADGHYVAFGSAASNLVSGDTNGMCDVFVHENDISTWTMSGNVRDANANPLDGVLISVTTPAGVEVASTLSLVDGTYQVPDMSGSTYLIYASKADYLFNPYPLTVILDSNRTGQNILGSLTSCILPNGNNGAIALGNMCRIPTAEPFLDLPFTYSDFTMTANGFELGSTFSGKVTAWIDHDLRQFWVRTWGQNISSSAGYKHWLNCYPPRSNCYDQHEGTDFYLSTGTPVKPAAPGVVAEVCKDHPPCERGEGYGRYVLIVHEKGYATLYAHLQSISVVVGDRFYPNTSFAPLGTSGRSGGGIDKSGKYIPFSETFWPAHLHFGLYFDLDNSGTWTNGEQVDPYGWKPPNNTSDPMERPNIYMWKYPINVSYCYNPSTVTQTAQFDNLTASFPPGSLTSDTTVTLGIGSLPGILLEALRSASQSFFLSLIEWSQAGSGQFTIQQASADFPTPASIIIEYEPSAILHLVESQLTINRWDDLSSSWISLPTNIDTTAHTATAQTDSAGSFILQAPLICPADTLEPNDNYDGANLVQTDGTLVSNLFDITTDEDWFKFDAVVGNKYVIQTTNLAAGVDTALEIYDTDGVTLLVSDDNGGGGNASSLTWQATQSGLYFARIVQALGSSFGCDSTYDFTVLDITPPSVVSSLRANPNPTNDSSVDFTITFSEAVTGVDTSDFTLTVTGLTGASVTGVSGSGATHTVTVNTGSGSGTLRLDVTDDDSIIDGASNPLGGGGAGNGNYTGSEAYTVDKTTPTVVSSVRAGPNPTSAASVNFTVTFSEAVTGVDTSAPFNEFDLTTTGVTGASISSVTGSGDTYTVTVDTGTGAGTIRLDVLDDDTIIDTAGNPLDGGYTSGEVYTINPCYTLTSASNPSAGGTVNASPAPNCPTDSTKYNYGTAVQLTAVPNAGYVFANWSGDATGTTNPVSVTMNGNKSVTANFIQLLAPEIAGVHPPEGSQVCPTPQVGVDLNLTDAMRQAGSFDLSTVTLTLDGKDVTQEAVVLGTLTYPQSRASVLYTPTTALTLGTHRAAFTFPSASGRSTFEWTFTVANAPCLPPEIAGVHPPEGSQVCPTPQVGVDLNLTDAMRQAGSFDLSTVTLTLDGKDVTQEAVVLGTLTYPQSRASVLYTPTTALALGIHRAAITFPSASGRSTFEWTFTVANVPCP